MNISPVSPHELDAWLQSTDVNDGIHQQHSVVTNKRKDFYNRRRSSLDEGNSNFGVDASTLLKFKAINQEQEGRSERSERAEQPWDSNGNSFPQANVNVPDTRDNVNGSNRSSPMLSVDTVPVSNMSNKTFPNELSVVEDDQSTRSKKRRVSYQDEVDFSVSGGSIGSLREDYRRQSCPEGSYGETSNSNVTNFRANNEFRRQGSNGSSQMDGNGYHRSQSDEGRYAQTHHGMNGSSAMNAAHGMNDMNGMGNANANPNFLWQCRRANSDSTYSTYCDVMSDTGRMRNHSNSIHMNHRNNMNDMPMGGGRKGTSNQGNAQTARTRRGSFQASSLSFVSAMEQSQRSQDFLANELEFLPLPHRNRRASMGAMQDAQTSRRLLVRLWRRNVRMSMRMSMSSMSMNHSHGGNGDIGNNGMECLNGKSQGGIRMDGNYLGCDNLEQSVEEDLKRIERQFMGEQRMMRFGCF